MNRQEYNRKIISKLTDLIEKYPDWRFGQLLVNCNVLVQEPKADDLITIDPFYEESEKTWNRIKFNKFIQWEN